MAERQPRGLSLRFKLTAAAAMLTITLVALEGVARVVGPMIPAYNDGDASGESVLLNPHPTRLWWTAPGVKKSAGFTAHINALGLRGDLPADPKPEGLPRVMVLGDSSLFGHGVADDETYPAQLQANLLAAGRAVEVINGATPGYSTEQTQVMLDEIGWALKPDLLIIGNLWSDNNFDSFQDADLLHTQHAFSGPLASSALYRLLATWADRAKGGRGAQIVRWTVDSQLPNEVGRRVPLARYAQNLEKMVQDATARGVGVVFLALTNTDRVSTNLTGASWDPYFAAQREVATFHKVPVIDAQSIFVGADLSDPSQLFVDTMHPSAQGHRLLASFTARRLIRDGWPDNQHYTASTDAFTGTTAIDNFEIGMRGPTSPQDRLFER